MGQYTDKVMEYMEIMEYIEQGNQCSAIEAQQGRMTKWFNHGGMTIEFLRDNVEYDGTIYNKGDIIESEPLDETYIKYNNEYNSVTPLFDSFRKLFEGKKGD